MFYLKIYSVIKRDEARSIKLWIITIIIQVEWDQSTITIIIQVEWDQSTITIITRKEDIMALDLVGDVVGVVEDGRESVCIVSATGV
jgi:hypothetical protein